MNSTNTGHDRKTWILSEIVKFLIVQVLCLRWQKVFSELSLTRVKRFWGVIIAFTCIICLLLKLLSDIKSDWNFPISNLTVHISTLRISNIWTQNFGT